MEEKELGKKKGTMVYGGTLSIKKFENGVIIKKRNQGQLILDSQDAGMLALNLRKFSYPKLFTEPQLETLKKKFKDNKDVCDFVDKIIHDKLKYSEDY